MNVNNSALFMNALGQQMAMARGGARQRPAPGAGPGLRCRGLRWRDSPLSAWGSALGGLGSVLGDGNASTLTYNFGGAAAGIDYRLDPRFLVGIGAGYTTRHAVGRTASWARAGPTRVSVAAYGSFTQGGLLRSTRWRATPTPTTSCSARSSIPGLQPRTASGSTGANQFLGQVETGYRFGIYAPAAGDASRRSPACRPRASPRTASPRWGAQSLNLNVAQQTTNSLRTTLGADLAGAIGLGNDAHARPRACGWAGCTSIADTARPITAAFAGAPVSRLHRLRRHAAARRGGDRLLGQHHRRRRDAALPALRRRDRLGTDNHALNVGVRMSW